MLKKIIERIKKDRKLQIIAIVIFLFLFSFTIRIYNLNSVPNDIAQDELQILVETEATKEGLWRDPFSLCFDLGHSCANMYVDAFFLRFFGEENSFLALRLPLALSTSIAVVLFFFVLKRKKISLPVNLCFSLLFSASYWFLNFSRSFWFNAHLIPLLLGIFLSLDFAFEKKKLWPFAIAGALSGVSLYGYHFARVMFLAISIFLIAKLIANLRKEKKFYFLGIILFAAATIYILWPQLEIIFRLPDQYFFRSQDVFISSMQVFWQNVLSTLNSIFLLQPPNFIELASRYNQRFLPDFVPIINNFVGLFFIGGFLFTFLKRWSTYYFWIVIVLANVLISTLTEYPLNGARLVTLLPAMYVLAAQFMQSILSRINFFYPRIKRSFYIALFFLTLVFVYSDIKL
jgi:hypothetical protein